MWRVNPGFEDRELHVALEQLRSADVRRDLDNAWARVLAIKLGVDGGVEAGYYREPYLFTDDAESPCGKPAVSQSNLEVFCSEAANESGVRCGPAIWIPDAMTSSAWYSQRAS